MQRFLERAARVFVLALSPQTGTLGLQLEPALFRRFRAECPKGTKDQDHPIKAYTQRHCAPLVMPGAAALDYCYRRESWE
jgi:hypothetical protein